MGIFWSLLSAFLWSTTFISARYLLAGKLVDPVTLSLLRFLIGGALLFIVGIVIHRSRFFAIRLTDYLMLAILGLFGIVGMSVLLFSGQQATTANNSSTIIQLSSLFVLGLGHFIGERLSSGKVVGCVLALLGTLFVVGVLSLQGIDVDSNHLFGDLLVMAAAFCWAIYMVISKSVVERIGSLRATTWAMLFGTIEIFFLRQVLPITHIWPEDGTSWVAILYIGVFPTAVAFFAWYEAMNKIPLALLNVMQYFTPLFTILLAWPLLGERVTVEKLIGIGIILLGIALVSKDSFIHIREIEPAETLSSPIAM
jgi:drug/metabolite transporter (DMT)-like permease